VVSRGTPPPTCEGDIGRPAVVSRAAAPGAACGAPYRLAAPYGTAPPAPRPSSAGDRPDDSGPPHRSPLARAREMGDSRPANASGAADSEVPWRVPGRRTDGAG